VVADDGNGGRRMRLILSFSPLGCPQKLPEALHAGFLEPTNGVLHSDPRPGEQIMGCDPRENEPGVGAHDGGRSEGGEERWEGRGQPRGGGSGGDGRGNPRRVATQHRLHMHCPSINGNNQQPIDATHTTPV
jgi:hypothetical protein